jgi:hypothetical protein
LSLDCGPKIVNLKRDRCDRFHKIRIGRSLPEGRRTGNESGLTVRLSVPPPRGKLPGAAAKAGAADLVCRAGTRWAATDSIRSGGIP